MKRVLAVVVLFAVLAQAGSAPTRAVSSQETAAPTPLPTFGAPGAMPGPPLPERPIPYHRPGRPSKAAGYTVQVTRLNAEGLAETVELTGLDALLADGTMDDPLQGNYRLVAENQVLVGALSSGDVRLSSVDVYSDTGPPPLVLNPLDGTAHTPAVGALKSDVTAGDLNGDYLDEQVAAWLDASGYVRLSVGAMPVTPELPEVTPPKVTSAPAAVAHSDGAIDLVVRGYDDALWHRHYDGITWGSWNNDLSSRLLSGPAIASRADGQFDVFVIGGGNLTYHRHWEAGGWSGLWVTLDDTTDWEPLEREVPAP